MTSTTTRTWVNYGVTWQYEIPMTEAAPLVSLCVTSDRDGFAPSIRIGFDVADVDADGTGRLVPYRYQRELLVTETVDEAMDAVMLAVMLATWEARPAPLCERKGRDWMLTADGRPVACDLSAATAKAMASRLNAF